MKVIVKILKILFCLTVFNFLQAYKYELAICAIFQNEARFMKEWIEFHKLVGVQHFYLFNNYSRDNFKNILETYIKKGEVELFTWNKAQIPGKGDWQCDAYNFALKIATGKVKWLAFLDLDEFLFPVKKDNLRDLLCDYEEFGGICANWVMFGTSKVKRVPRNKLMIECLIKCDAKGNKHVKSIVRPERVDRFKNSHFAVYKPNFFQVNSNKIKFKGPFSPEVCLDKLRINHYWSRDIYYFLNVKIPRKEAREANNFPLENWYVPLEISNNISTRMWCFIVNRYINVNEDTTIHKYLPRLKKIMRN